MKDLFHWGTPDTTNAKTLAISGTYATETLPYDRRFEIVTTGDIAYTLTATAAAPTPAADGAHIMQAGQTKNIITDQDRYILNIIQLTGNDTGYVSVCPMLRPERTV